MGYPILVWKLLVLVNLVMVILSTLIVAARFAARLSVHRGVGIDDWLILSVVVRFFASSRADQKHFI